MTTKTTRTPCRLRQTTGSERRHATRLALAASTALTPAALVAEGLPTGGQVVQGAAQIAQPGPTQLNVNQSSDRAVINWNGFSVGQGNAVNFNQPTSNSATLNRVTGGLPSQIDGSITANGHVYLVNPRGVVVGPTGRIDAQGFVASSLQTDDDEFMQGRLRFEGNGNSAGVANHGTITVGQGGLAALLGGKVENTGTIVAPMGKIGFGAGEMATIDLTGDGFLQIAMPSDSDTEVLINQAGRVSADGGLIQMQAATARDAARRVVNLSGVTEARSVSGRNGSIILGGGAGGTVNVTGAVSTSQRVSSLIVDASPRPAERPNIVITGRSINLDGATIGADLEGGGGSIRIGGDFAGGPAIPTSDVVNIDADATISARALTEGNGGDIAIWSDEFTSFEGTVDARAAGTGDGGFVEVSSAKKLIFTGLATVGRGGVVLLDPQNFEICAPGECQLSDSVVDPASILNGLESFGSFVVDTDLTGVDSGRITVTSAIDEANDPDTQNGTLFFNANEDILINAPILLPEATLQITAGEEIFPGVGITSGDINVDRFFLNGGTWLQRQTTPASFAANDFRLGFGTTFLRAAGDGSTLDPFEINDVYGLQGMASAGSAPTVPGNPILLESNWELGSDIDASVTAGWFDFGEGFEGFRPIGDSVDFTGTLEGNGFEISGLTMIREDQAGLFAFTTGATISNLTLSDVGVAVVDTEGAVEAGGLVANALDTDIQNVSVGGTVSDGFFIFSDAILGGVVGIQSGGSLDNVTFDGTVEVEAFDVDVVLGGVVGQLEGDLQGGVINVAAGTGAVTGGPDQRVDVFGAPLVATLGGTIGVIDVTGEGAPTQVSATGTTVSTFLNDSSGTFDTISLGGVIGTVNNADQLIEIGVSSTVTDARVGADAGGSILNIGGLVGENSAILEVQPLNSIDLDVVDVNGGFQNIGLVRAGGIAGLNAGSGVINANGFIHATGSIDVEFRDAAFVGGVAGENVGQTNAVDADMTITTVSIGDGSGGAYNTEVGGAVGRNSGLIGNALVDGTINASGTGEFAVGGVAGVNSGSVVDLASSGINSPMSLNLGTSGDRAQIDGGLADVGGLIGLNSGDVTEAGFADANISVFTENAVVQTEGETLTFVGGYVGRSLGGSIDGTLPGGGSPGGADAFGNVSVDALGNRARVGGFIGESTDTTIDTARAFGNVDVTSNVGGAVGGFVGATATAVTGATFTNVKAEGSSVVFSEDPTPLSAASPVGIAIGGFVGGFDGEITVASATPDVSASTSLIDQYVGGFVGVHGGIVTDVYALGDVSSNGGTTFNSVGGLVGQADGSDVDGSISAGSVSATDGVTAPSIGFNASVGTAPPASVLDAFYDITNAPGADSFATGLTTVELQDTDFTQSVIASLGAANWAPGAPGLYPQLYAIDAVIFADPDDVTITFNDAPPALTGTTQGGPGLYVFDDSLDTIDLTSVFDVLVPPDTQANPVPYDLTAPPGTATSDLGITYDVIYGVADYLINPAPLEITTLDQAKEFGDDAFALDETETVGWVVSLGTLVAGDITDVTLDSLGELPDADAGDYAIDAVGANGPGVTNYVITFVEDGILTVTQRDMDIFIDTLDQTKTYGDSGFALAETEDEGWVFVGDPGFVGSDGISTIELSSVGEDVTAPVGTYDIAVGDITGIGLENYNITVNPVGDLTVVPLAIDLTITTLDQEKTYGVDFGLNEAEGIGWTQTGGGFINGDTLTGVSLTSTGTDITAPVTEINGPYAIGVAGLQGSGIENYVINFANEGELTVLRAPLEITTLDQNKLFGDAEFALAETEGAGWAITSGALLNSDTLATVELSSTGEDAAAPVGTYEILAGETTGTGLGNYAIDFVLNGVLTIDPRSLTIALTTLNQTKTYGDAEFALAETEGLGWEITDGAFAPGDGVDLIPLASAGEDPTAGIGDYTIFQDGELVGTGLSNYEIEVVPTGELTVVQREIDLTITTLDQTKVYGTAGFSLNENEGIGFTITGDGEFVNGDGLTGVALSSEGEVQEAIVDEYAITAAPVGNGVDNYSFNIVNSGELDVTRAPLTIIANDQTKTEGESFTFEGTEFTVEGLLPLNDDAVLFASLSSDGAAQEAEAGDSTILISDPVGRGLGNYAETLVPGTFTVAAVESERPDVIIPPNQPNLPDLGDATIGDGGGGLSLGGGIVSAPGATATQTGAQSIQVAESVLAVIDRASSDLQATVETCRETDQAVTDFLGCVSDALESFSATLDPATLDLPQELASVSAAVIVARQGVDAARARAQSRLAGVTDPAVRRQIELDAVAEARTAIQTAEVEVTKAIGLLRADDPELASVYREQANTVVAALNSVEVELQRAVGL